VIPETVWILGRLFDPATPAGLYAGLRVKGGSINLSAVPVITAGKLTISAATTADCSFDLEQNDAFGNDPTSPFGIDARNAEFRLPENFQFSFRNLNKTIKAVGKSAWRVYGAKNAFAWGGDQACTYNALLGRLAIPLKCEDPGFAITDCQSPFCAIAGSTSIAQSWWALPLASIDINAPTEADGNGALIALCNAGLSALWQGLQQRRMHLQQPFILGEPGRIALTELNANGGGAMQALSLW